MNIKNIVMVFVVALFVLVPASASAQTETTLIARYGIAPSGAGYKLVEVFVSKKNGWIPLDAGYLDFRSAGQYRELFIGAGRVLVANEKMLVIGELYYDQASDGAAYVQPWILIAYTFTPSVRVEAVYFPYLPLNEKGVTQQVLERVKFEKSFGSYKIGVGYSGYQFGDNAWQSKPFVSVTKKTKKHGSLELWLQKTPTGPGVQFRYSVSFK